MHEFHHEHTPDIHAFLQATQKAVDLDYDYVVEKVGIDTFLRDTDAKKMAKIAISLLYDAGIEAGSEVFSESLERTSSSNTHELSSSSDEASIEYLRLLAGTLGSINGYSLTMITANELILDQFVRTKDDCLITISLDVQLSPIGLYVAKDRYTVFPGRTPMKDPLEVGPEDSAIIDAFVQKIIDIR